MYNNFDGMVLYELVHHLTNCATMVDVIYVVHLMRMARFLFVELFVVDEVVDLETVLLTVFRCLLKKRKRIHKFVVFCVLNINYYLIARYAL